MIAELEQIERASIYLRTLLRRRGDYVNWLWNEKRLYHRYPLTALYEDVANSTSQAGSFEELALMVRECKQRHFLRIGGRDLLGLADFRETTSQLSDLASVILQVGMDRLSSNPDWWMRDAGMDEWRQVKDAHAFVIMGLGKLGGEELNYVSDIDLSFMRQARRFPPPHSSAEFIDRFFRYITRLFSDPFEGDRVFLVDLRLRPGGKDGELVPSVSAAADYYLNHGRAWERQMLLKARPVAGDRTIGKVFLQEVRPFVFRRFLDFQAIDELRDMKARILVEATKFSRDEQIDVKLGPGGIREIEFIVQLLQLVYGGRYPELDEPNTLRCLERLGKLGLLENQIVSDLERAYIFLRRVEHWIQLDQNRRTHKLPNSPSPRRRLTFAMGFGDDEKRFLHTLNEHRDMVHKYFADLLKPASSLRGNLRYPRVSEGLDKEVLGGLGKVLESFPCQLKRAVFDEISHFEHLGRKEVSQKVRARLESYFSKVRRRPGLIRLFEREGQWVRALCRGLARSEMISSLLLHQPGLSEGVMAQYGHSPFTSEWEQSAGNILAKNLEFEETIEWIRRVKNERILVLALADLEGLLTFESLEEELTRIADFVIRQTYKQVLNHLGEASELPLVILGLGKLGSREIGYLSDLDLMFVYDPGPGESPDQIPIRVVRLVQRFTRILSTPLQEGPGYPVDVRIRPTGNYGPLIVTYKAWVDYYQNQADLWEIQALLRMRPIAGNSKLASYLEAAAKTICNQPRDAEMVWTRLCYLRKRMEQERAAEDQDSIDLKVGYGGLADLEFLVQGMQLIHGHRFPSLVHRSVRRSLPRILEFIGLSKEEVYETESLFDAFRALEHRLQLHLNLATSKLRESSFTSMLHFEMWPPSERYSRLESWRDLIAARHRVRRIWNKVC